MISIILNLRKKLSNEIYLPLYSNVSNCFILILTLKKSEISPIHWTDFLIGFFLVLSTRSITQQTTIRATSKQHDGQYKHRFISSTSTWFMNRIMHWFDALVDALICFSLSFSLSCGLKCFYYVEALLWSLFCVPCFVLHLYASRT